MAARALARQVRDYILADLSHPHPRQHRVEHICRELADPVQATRPVSPSAYLDPVPGVGNR